MLASASMGPAFSLASTLGVMVAAAGALTPAALAVTTAIMLLLALTFTQLVSRYPDAGSSYGWARRAFGDGAGAYTAWILLVANFFAVLATAIPAGTYTLALVAPRLVGNAAWDAGVGSLWILACAVILYFGVRSSAMVAAVLLVAELAILAFSAAGSAVESPPAPSAALPSAGIGGFVAAVVFGIWMVDGWEVSASTSEETRSAPRVAGRGGVVGLLVTAAFLFVCTAAYLHGAGTSGLANHQLDALAFVGERLGGAWRAVLIVTVLVSLTASLETTLLYLVRSVYAMGRDEVLPPLLGRLGAGTRDPDIALAAVTAASLAAMGVVAFVPSANAGLSLVLGGTAVFLGILFLTSCAAALRLRAPEDTPLFALAGGVTLAAILLVAIVQAAPATRLCVLTGLTLGMPVAFIYQRRRRFGKVQSPAVRNIGG